MVSTVNNNEIININPKRRQSTVDAAVREGAIIKQRKLTPVYEQPRTLPSVRSTPFRIAPKQTETLALRHQWTDLDRQLARINGTNNQITQQIAMIEPVDTGTTRLMLENTSPLLLTGAPSEMTMVPYTPQSARQVNRNLTPRNESFQALKAKRSPRLTSWEKNYYEMLARYGGIKKK
jgi:hypothetical protein